MAGKEKKMKYWADDYKNKVILPEKLERATLRIVDKAGHMAMVEKPFEVNASILKFLATL